MIRAVFSSANSDVYSVAQASAPFSRSIMTLSFAAASSGVLALARKATSSIYPTASSLSRLIFEALSIKGEL
ncbi:hypothetical protein BDV93DRAFT_527126 [Ceratobasidium sp. AG-I]|nr:hypothetical protein BDV93DRAFT_527126 [Ceratobasidium sp. AG-I]